LVCSCHGRRKVQNLGTGVEEHDITVSGNTVEGVAEFRYLNCISHHQEDAVKKYKDASD